MVGEELDKSEDATPHKLKRAREKGQIARSADVGIFAILLALIGYMVVAAPAFGQVLAQITRDILITAPQVAMGPQPVLAIAGIAFFAIAVPLALFGGLVWACTLFFEILQTGALFSTTPLKPDFTRINPGQGLKRIFSIRALVETAKSIAKLVVYAAIGALVVNAALQQASSNAAAGLSTRLALTVVRLLMYFAAAAFAFAMIDQILVRRRFGKTMRMSRRELKREYREREGEPRLKQRRKQMHAEFMKIRKSVANARSADIFIVNPVHIAIGLRYDRTTMAAPVVIAKGRGWLAQTLKRIASLYGVVLIEDRALALALQQKSVLDGEIPEELYADVAAHYRRYRPSSTIRTP
jgi:flagellar biosynthesis protein FlhB